MIFKKWWYCDRCGDARNVTTTLEISEHGRKQREEANTRQAQKFVDTYVE